MAQALANQYIERYRSLGDAVVFCSVVARVQPLEMSRCHFRQLANAFNSQLRESTSRISPSCLFFVYKLNKRISTVLHVLKVMLVISIVVNFLATTC